MDTNLQSSPEPPSDEWYEERRPAAFAFMQSACALVKRVQTGEITEQQAKEGIMKLLEGNGTDIEQRAEFFLLHTLHQPELDEYTRRTGNIID